MSIQTTQAVAQLVRGIGKKVMMSSVASVAQNK